MGADLSLSTSLDLNGTLNANGHAIATPTVYLGRNGGPVALQNDGLVTSGGWNQSGADLPPFHVPGAMRVGSIGSVVSAGRRSVAEPGRGHEPAYAAGVR